MFNLSSDHTVISADVVDECINKTNSPMQNDVFEEADGSG